MKSTSFKSVLFAVLALISLSCFIYVNTTSLDRTLQVAGVNQPTVETVKMPDLTLVKSVLTLVQTFFPAK